jgi:hypothetical protein
MTTQFKARFTDGNGSYYHVNEVVNTPLGLTVYYYNDGTGTEYSCLLEAFSQRFREVQDND